MLCNQCEIWELTDRDNFCSWCGANWIRFEVHLDRPELPRSEYPPPIEVVVRNGSQALAIEVERIAGSAEWISHLSAAELPVRVPPGGQHSFLVDVDTFSSGSTPSAEIVVEVAHGGSRSRTLRLL